MNYYIKRDLFNINFLDEGLISNDIVIRVLLLNVNAFLVGVNA